MDMTYTTNPNIARVRMQAVTMVRRGASTRATARHFGFNQSTIVRWVNRANEEQVKGSSKLVTLSSRPHTHPSMLSEDIVAMIVAHRRQYNRCAEVIHKDLSIAGAQVSLSSVKRTLKREGLIPPKSKWKRYRPHIERPHVTAPGDLVQTDTIHFIRYREGTRYYVYTSIDLYSRFAHAVFVQHLSQRHSYQFILASQRRSGCRFQTVQADNGPEFGRWFGDQLKTKDIALRHSRIHRPNDNAHIERFNRTIQDECLGRHPKPEHIPEMLQGYLRYYNYERRHLGINLQKPIEVMQRS